MIIENFDLRIVQSVCVWRKFFGGRSELFLYGVLGFVFVSVWWFKLCLLWACMLVT